MCTTMRAQKKLASGWLPFEENFQMQKDTLWHFTSLLKTLNTLGMFILLLSTKLSTVTCPAMNTCNGRTGLKEGLSPPISTQARPPSLLHPEAPPPHELAHLDSASSTYHCWAPTSPPVCLCQRTYAHDMKVHDTWLSQANIMCHKPNRNRAQTLERVPKTAWMSWVSKSTFTDPIFREHQSCKPIITSTKPQGISSNVGTCPDFYLTWSWAEIWHVHTKVANSESIINCLHPSLNSGLVSVTCHFVLISNICARIELT